jgi:hypothetical protein
MTTTTRPVSNGAEARDLDATHRELGGAAERAVPVVTELRHKGQRLRPFMLRSVGTTAIGRFFAAFGAWRVGLVILALSRSNSYVVALMMVGLGRFHLPLRPQYVA